MGRGTTHEVNKGYTSLSAFRVSEIYTMKACDKVKFDITTKTAGVQASKPPVLVLRDDTYMGEVSEKSHVLQPFSSSTFHDFPSSVSSGRP